MLTIGDKAPAFQLRDQHNTINSLNDHLGQWVLLYFYPEDDTPGCVVEAQKFRDAFQQFIERQIVVLGVSADSVESHKHFAAKYHLPFKLLSDPDKSIISAYGAKGGRRGIKRISFLLNDLGQVAKIYNLVKPENHAAQILADYTKLVSSSKATTK